MLSIYPACFIKDAEGYTVTFPDWDGAVTCGKNFEEAMKMAVDCLAGLLYDCKLDGKQIPKATKLNNINLKKEAKRLDCDANDVLINMVSVDAEEYARNHFEKCVKKTVTILEWQNREGIKQGINFSKLLQDALTETLRKASITR